jgi:putative membrane protein
MGSADIIPGVSGGTIAFITGIYERFVNALKSIDFKFIFYFFKGFFNKSYFSKAKNNFSSIDFKFLIPLGLGVVIAFLTLANVLKYFLTTYQTYTYSFFFGLILSSSIFVYLSNKKSFNLTGLLFIFLGLILGYVIVGFNAIQMDHSHIIIFCTGIISFCAMILPGISGAFILWLLGQYEFMLDVLSGFTHFEFVNISYALVYILGGLVGLIGFSRVLSFLMRKHRSIALSFILGLMIGALRKPGELIMSNPENLILTLFAFCIGLIIVTIFSYYEFFYHKNIRKNRS